MFDATLQIVRADLQELYDLDLGGAPYGYTPFCDSRKEMDGFRFVLMTLFCFVFSCRQFLAVSPHSMLIL